MNTGDVKSETNSGHVRSIVGESVDRIRGWAFGVPCFAELCPEDQNTLFDAAAPDLISLRVANRLVKYTITPRRLHNSKITIYTTIVLQRFLRNCNKQTIFKYAI